jgi:hypothetical protein
MVTREDDRLGGRSHRYQTIWGLMPLAQSDVTMCA